MLLQMEMRSSPHYKANKSLITILLLQLYLLVNCHCLASDSSLHQPRIISRKNGISKQFSIDEYTRKRSPSSTTPTKTTSTPPTTRRAINIKDTLKWQEVKSIVKTTFLPIGFPEKTPHGYLSFSMWSWTQDISTQLRAILATQRVLEGVGVGREGATALSASINFIVRDGFGMASTLMFTALSSDKFRSNVKKWRLFADMINDVGITLEVAATLVPRHLFLPMICAGNMCKAICGVGAGACNGAINVHWSKGSDISDINAKFGAQHTVTGSLGLIFAAYFAKSVNNISPNILWFLYLSLTALHIFANMMCLRLVAFDYFNTERMTSVVESFLDRIRGGEDSDKIFVEEPITISSQEGLFFGLSGRIPIHMGVSFDSLVRSSQMDNDGIQEAIEDVSHQKYTVVLGSNRSISVAVSEDAETADRTKGYFHALILRKLVESDHSIRNGKALKDAVQEVVAKLWPQFVSSASKAQWDLSKTELSNKGYEISIQS